MQFFYMKINYSPEMIVVLVTTNPPKMLTIFSSTVETLVMLLLSAAARIVLLPKLIKPPKSDVPVAWPYFGPISPLIAIGL